MKLFIALSYVMSGIFVFVSGSKIAGIYFLIIGQFFGGLLLGKWIAEEIRNINDGGKS